MVLRHAAELDRELPRRRAGTEQERVTATYILSHLERAGYALVLDRVPVANLVTSTNVIALPRGGGDPRVVVTVAYDVGGNGGGGHRIGFFLELARALSVTSANHGVAFAALGAEHARRSGGRLGSRRLASFLREGAHEPLVVSLRAIRPEASAGFEAAGDGAEELVDVARRVGIESATAARSYADDPLSAAGFDRIVVRGGVARVGRVLLEFLAHR